MQINFEKILANLQKSQNQKAHCSHYLNNILVLNYLHLKLCVVADTYNPTIGEAEAEASRIRGYPRVHSKALSEKKDSLPFPSNVLLTCHRYMYEESLIKTIFHCLLFLSLLLLDSFYKD